MAARSGSNVQSNLDSLRKNLRGNVAECLQEAGTVGAERASQTLAGTLQAKDKKAGSRAGQSIHSDTGALDAAIYIIAPGLNTYRESRDNAEREYLKRYTDSHFRQRLLPQVVAGEGQSSMQGGFGVLLAYGIWWEYGHKNNWTGEFEKSPWFRDKRVEVQETLQRCLAGRNLLAPPKK